MPAPSSEFFSGLKETLDPATHFFVIHQFAAVGLLDASLHASHEPRPVGEHPVDSLTDELFRVPAGRRSYLLDLRFDLGWEMHIHVAKIALWSRCWR